MALRMVDSFDHYASAQITRKWSTLDNMTISAGNGRRSTASLRASTANNANVTRVLDSQATWIVGYSFRITTFSGSSAAAILALLDGVSMQVDLRLAVDGSLVVTRNGTTLSSSAAGVIAAATTNYIEFKATIGNAGSYEVRVNGATVLSASGVDTQNTANATANIVRIGSGSASTGWTNADFDDLYICDGTGAANNDFLGDVRVDCFLPNGNGNSSQLVGSDADSTDNYLLVDESLVNDNSDYVESASVNDQDTYAFANMAHTPTSIYGLQINLHAVKTDAGFRSIQSVTRSGGTDTDGDVHVLGSSYVNYRQVLETDPDTSAAWSQSGFDAAEFGMKVEA